MTIKTKLITLAVIVFLLLALSYTKILPSTFTKMSSIIYIIAFFLNLIYEFAHSWLYDWKKPPLKPELKFYLKIILNSTLGDAFFITSFIWAISIIKWSIAWLISPMIMDYAIIVLMGMTVAFIMETHARKTDRWYYNKYMPKVFKVGVTPLIQLSLTGVLTLKILEYL